MIDSVPQLATLGHSNRQLNDLLALLAEAGVSQLIDIRRLPRSKRHPCFNQTALAQTLHHHNIHYLWQGDCLGGLRKATPASPHTGLEEAFRGFADYMATPAFLAGINTLMETARHRPSAIMCAERNPKHCHRSLIADYLSKRQWRVTHWLDTRRSEPHRPHPALRWTEGQAVYDRLSQHPLCL